MESLGLLVGHLLGDYIFQNDWMALNKQNDNPGPRPTRTKRPLVAKPVWTVDAEPDGLVEFNAYVDAVNSDKEVYDKSMLDWELRRIRFQEGTIAWLVHCILYTICVWACSYWWMPLWGVLVCFVTHLVIDRFKTAKWWMTYVSGQFQFAQPPLAPWSIIAVDNTFHLLTLFIIGILS